MVCWLIHTEMFSYAVLFLNPEILGFQQNIMYFLAFPFDASVLKIFDIYVYVRKVFLSFDYTN